MLVISNKSYQQLYRVTALRLKKSKKAFGKLAKQIWHFLWRHRKAIAKLVFEIFGLLNKW